MTKAIFLGLCPNCGGGIEDSLLIQGLPCEKCLPREKFEQLVKKRSPSSELELKRLVCELLEKEGRLQRYSELVKLEEELEEFSKFFERATGNPPWSAQRTWARRVLEGRSFAIIAPTGVGKSVFGTVMALYKALRGEKSYIVVPTTLLAQQAYALLQRLSESVGASVRIAYYTGGLKESERKQFIEALESGEFDVLITTSQYLAMSFDNLSKHRFDYIFVDDVDAVLKSSKNVDRLLTLLGYSSEIINRALELIKLKVEFARYASSKKDYESLSVLAAQIHAARSDIDDFVKRSRVGVLVVSSATGRPRGMRIRLFRELLGFEVGSRAEFIRNVQDIYAYPRDGVESAVIELVKRLDSGGLVYVPTDKGIEYAETLASKLREEGIRADVVHAKERKSKLSEFAEGEIDVLVGVATYYGLLVRGIDLPQRIRYVVFAGVPRFRFTLEVDEIHPIRLIQLLMDLREFMDEKEKLEATSLLSKLRRVSKWLTAPHIKAIKEWREKGGTLPPYLERVEELLSRGSQLIQELLSRDEVVEAIRRSPHIMLESVEDRYVALVPDVMTYIQASGRTSRMFAGGISRGISIVIVDNEKLLNGLIRKTRWIFEDIAWKALEEVDLNRLKEEVDRDREFIRKLLAGEIKGRAEDPVQTALLIVESPNKARTISNFFGKPSVRHLGPITVYEVGTGDKILNIVASGGHVYDLSVSQGFHGVLFEGGAFIPVYATIKRCRRCGEQFVEGDSCPQCGSRDYWDTVNVVEALRSIAHEFDVVLLGTDPDTEGEKISWDIYCTLSPYAKSIKRVEFHEVTKSAVLNAIKNPREIDLSLVEAQIVRRIEDRWIGFELSQQLWKQFRDKHLSAGRVQTPVLGWVIDRFREYQRSFRMHYRVKLENGFEVVFEDARPRKYAQQIEEALMNSLCRLEVLGEYEDEMFPPPPFCTDSLIRESSALLGLGASETMGFAQELFEMGFITYHRTDSIRVSQMGRAIAREYVSEKFGSEMFVPREWSTEGAHECIRPTRPVDADQLQQLIQAEIISTPRPLTKRHFQLYNLIFRRFVASQMRPARVVRARVLAKVWEFSKEEEVISKVLEPGFTQALEPRWKKFEGSLGGEYRVVEVKHWRAPTVMLYSEGDLVAEMRIRGIGRPSTYAKIVDTLRIRKYVKEVRGKRLAPTRRGVMIYSYLMDRFGSLVSEERTRLLEEKMKLIESGEVSYQSVLSELFEELTKTVRGETPSTQS